MNQIVYEVALIIVPVEYIYFSLSLSSTMIVCITSNYDLELNTDDAREYEDVVNNYVNNAIN